MSEDPAARELARIQKWNLVVLAAAIGGAAWHLGPSVAEAAAIGGALGAANFWLTAQVIRRTFVPEGGDERPGGALIGLKFLALFAVVGGVLWYVHPDTLGFGLGFCSILVAIVGNAVADLVTQKSDDEDSKG
ncbi:MAG TPA: hypothetical protein VMV18_10115 [bacterium]|nr:hypothetical protein [bacterium]